MIAGLSGYYFPDWAKPEDPMIFGDIFKVIGASYSPSDEDPQVFSQPEESSTC
jgi:hypothetical protein